jgi:hypothetical protein
MAARFPHCEIVNQGAEPRMEVSLPPLAYKADLSKEATRAYETLLRCREVELNLHSTRSNLCLVVEGALLSFVAPAILALKPDAQLEQKLVPLLLALSGVVVSLVCIVIVRGASFWVAYWEYRLAQTELTVLPTISIFRDHPSAQNESLLKVLPKHLRYVSSRTAMLWLFRLLTGFWVSLFVFVLIGVGWAPPSRPMRLVPPAHAVAQPAHAADRSIAPPRAAVARPLMGILLSIKV